MPNKEEIIEMFNISYANKLTDLLMDIKNDYEHNALPLLNNPTHTMASDFVDIILYNVKEKGIVNNGSK
jgi:hypothetical protein